VARGNAKPGSYPHLTFEVPKYFREQYRSDYIRRYAYYLLKKGTFVGWCLHDTGYTYATSVFA
jgi:hypothetical protein